MSASLGVCVLVTWSWTVGSCGDVEYITRVRQVVMSMNTDGMIVSMILVSAVIRKVCEACTIIKKLWTRIEGAEQLKLYTEKINNTTEAASPSPLKQTASIVLASKRLLANGRLAVEHAPAVRPNIHQPSLVRAPSHNIGTNRPKALRPLDILPRRTIISRGIQLRTL